MQTAFVSFSRIGLSRDHIKERLILSVLAVIIVNASFGTTKFAISSHQPFCINNSFIQSQNGENVTLIFKVTGLKSEEDARIIDEILMTTSFISSSYTDFKTGICKVVTASIENKENIIEIISYKASNKIGTKLSAELVETVIEK